jgi:hypothetical protein
MHYTLPHHPSASLDQVEFSMMVPASARIVESRSVLVIPLLFDAWAASKSSQDPSNSERGPCPRANRCPEVKLPVPLQQIARKPETGVPRKK